MVESTQPILRRAFWANIPTTKSQTGIMGVRRIRKHHKIINSDWQISPGEVLGIEHETSRMKKPKIDCSIQYVSLIPSEILKIKWYQRYIPKKSIISELTFFCQFF